MKRFFLAALLLAAPAAATPRSIADCESIQEADAFNRCLASFGPVRGQHGASYPGAASDGARGKSSGHGYRRHAHGGAVSYGRHGRMHMEFVPGQR